MLLTRQKILLTLLESFGGKLLATDFQKYLFLFTQLCEKEKSFDFVPYRFGCFSFQSMADKKKLIEKGYLKDTTEWELQGTEEITAFSLDSGVKKKLGDFSLKFKNLKGKALIQHIYKKYPYYAIRSEIAKENLSAEDFAIVENMKPVRRRSPLFATIGYEGSSIESYINTLIQNDIRVLVDVRKNPISRKYGFSKNTLSSLLGKLGIEYQHIPALGIESTERQHLTTQSDYDLLFSRYEKTVLKSETNALNELYSIYLDKKRIAITCFEKEHCQCHRSRVANSIQSISKNTVEIQNL
jgi:Protein of unknown function, DUF488